MKGTPRSPFWSAPATSWKRQASPSKSPWRSPARATSSPPIRRPAGFDRFSLRPHRAISCWICREEARHFACTICWPWAARIRMTSSEPFNMAYLAIRGSGAVNGVSRLHGKVSRHIFLPLFPRWPEEEIPVGHVTNGVHVPTWDSAPAMVFGRGPVARTAGWGRRKPWKRRFAAIPDAQLWQFRTRHQQVSGRVRPRTIVPALKLLGSVGRGGRSRQTSL